VNVFSMTGMKKEVSFLGSTGILGVSPNFIKVPPRLGDSRGLKILIGPTRLA
jgi:hypothetical protein